MTSQRRSHGKSWRAVAVGTVFGCLAAPGLAAAPTNERSGGPPAGGQDQDASPARGLWVTHAQEVKAARHGYRGALEALASASAAEGLSALLAFEERFTEDGAAIPSRITERGEKEVLSWLAARDAEAVLPILLLHVDAFRHHRDKGNQPLADYEAAMALRAAAHYAAGIGTPAARAEAAEPLAAVGVALQEEVRRTAAHGMLTAARELDPDNATALLALAVDREGEGDYDQVVSLLEHLLATSDSAEARLRLAINLRRTGRRRDAAETLAALLHEPDADWVAMLAYQELAAMRLGDGDAEDAARLLRQGLERFPDSERLVLQLAYALDRGGDPAAARETVAELAASPPASGRGGTPRHRYNWGSDTEPRPVFTLAPLRERAAGLAPRLGTALEALAAEEAER